MRPDVLVYVLRIAGVHPGHIAAPTVRVQIGPATRSLGEQIVQVERDAGQSTGRVVLHRLEDQASLRRRAHPRGFREGLRAGCGSRTIAVAQHRAGDVRPVPAVDVVCAVAHPVVDGDHARRAAAILEVVVQGGRRCGTLVETGIADRDRLPIAVKAVGVPNLADAHHVVGNVVSQLPLRRRFDPAHAGERRHLDERRRGKRDLQLALPFCLAFIEDDAAQPFDARFDGRQRLATEDADDES